jgi:hypothetical protein
MPAGALAVDKEILQPSDDNPQEVFLNTAAVGEDTIGHAVLWCLYAS